MQNFSFNASNQASGLNTNQLLQENRRKSLGNLGASLAASEQLQNENRRASFYSCMMNQNNNKSDLIEELQNQQRFSSILMSINNNNNNENNNNLSQANLFFAQQQQQQQQQQLQEKQSQENLASFLRSYNLSATNLSNIYQNQNNESLNTQMMNRRRSYGPIASSPLRPVHESRSSSPTFSFPTQQQSVLNDKSFGQYSSHSNQKLSRANSGYNLQSGSRFRANSLGSIASTSFGDTGQHSSLSSVLSNFSNLKFSDSSLEEKLATTGNIFTRRDDWSIISKLPINKQNTIHIRLEDEGPYGNDETRCFVLSHLSSLGVRELDCVFCDSKLVVYDRFPLIDGTLFVSPYCYDKEKQVPATVSGKDQFLYGICLKCLSGTESEHEIKCKNCNKLWQTDGNYLQIGTLYKYDIFAANPCCQMRLNCKQCNQPVIEFKAGGLPYFSMYSEKKPCPNCSSEDFHFIKEIDDIFIKHKSD